MPAVGYQLHHWGNKVNKGATTPYHVAVMGIAKTAIPHIPRVVANELICADLGRAIRLPIPPSFLVYKDSVPYHVSLNFSLAGESLPDIDPAVVAAAQQDLCCGIILFDNWICNGDRNTGNVAFDATTKRVMLFDHSHAFMSSINWRQTFEEQIQLPTFFGHVFAPFAESADLLVRWFDRIMAVPEFYIREAVGHGADPGMTPDDSAFVADFLLDRRKRLMDIVTAAKAAFPKMAAAEAKKADGNIKPDEKAQ
jgi:hypothetical protein